MTNTLTPEMKALISSYPLGAVATINDDGTPAVSPKGTFVIVDDGSVAFGEMRSPQTVHNLIARPAVEVNFMDVLARRAVRVKGRGVVIDKQSEEGNSLVESFKPAWSDYIDYMRAFVLIKISAVSLINSPAYDLGLTEEELTQVNLDKMKLFAAKKT